MKRLSTVKYIAETSIEDIVKKVKDDKQDIFHVIDVCKESRTEYGMKIQELIQELTRQISKQ
jgi:hypothetical protein